MNAIADKLLTLYGLRRGAGQAEDLNAIADNPLPKFQDHLALHDQECRPTTTPAHRQISLMGYKAIYDRDSYRLDQLDISSDPFFNKEQLMILGSCKSHLILSLKSDALQGESIRVANLLVNQ